MEQQKPQDEIDLLELSAKLIISIKENFKLILIYFLAGTVVGGAYYMIAPKIYESKLMLQSDILTESYGEKITEGLNDLIKEDNTQILSARLGVSLQQAAQLSKIEIESIKSKDNTREEKESSVFIVTVRTEDKNLLPKLQDGIINYLKGNEYVKIRVQQRENFYRGMIQKVQLEIKSLDSLKTRLFAGKPIYSKSAEMMLVDPTSIYSKIIELNKELLNYKNSLELASSIQLVEGFTIFNKPVTPKLSISLSAGSSLGLFLVLMVIGFKSTRRIIQLSEEKLSGH